MTSHPALRGLPPDGSALLVTIELSLCVTSEIGLFGYHVSVNIMGSHHTKGPRFALRIHNVHGLRALLITSELFASVIAHSVSKLPGYDRSVVAVTLDTG